MTGAPERPTATALTALGVDEWSALLAVALPVVRQLPDRDTDAAVKRVAALPPGRLVSGRSRADLAEVLARAVVWERVEASLPTDAPRPWEAAAGPDTADRGEADLVRVEQQLAHLRDREQTLVDRVASLREDVDRLRRERDGAVARADRAEGAEREAVAQRDEAHDRARVAREAAEAAEDRVAKAVARARRRDDGEVADQREQLRAVRRERDALRTELEAARERLEAAERALAAAPAPAGSRAVDDGTRGRRGRPSRLPEGVAAGTRRAAEWLVADGRVLLVDGYNVTRTHRPDLGLAEQRRWLEAGVDALARRRQVDATIIWDSARGTPTTRRSRSGVTVRFTEEGATADDELVLHVQLALEPDAPVVVVTDDVELRDRLAAHRVDLLDSTSFTWLL